jgi:hypothetical protein
MRAARFRIRVNEREVAIGDTAELARLVRSGRIGPATEIWDEHAASWTVVGRLEGISESGGDPWSAWDEVESSGAAFEPPVEPAPRAEPVVQHPATDPPLVARAPEPTVSPVEAVEPAQPVEAQVEDDEDLVPTGEVIAFPTERIDLPRRRTHGSHALAERPVALPQHRPSRSEPPRLRLSIVLGTSIIGFLGLGWWVWYVDTASKAPPGPTGLAVVQATPPVDVPAPPPSPAQAQLRVVEQELVERLPEETRTIATESDLEMALNTELAALGIDVIEADAKVFSWTLSDAAEGAAARVPQVVEFSVRIRPAGAQLSDREQGAIALVVGRYIAAYDLVVTQFDVVVETADALPRTVPTDAMRAQRLAEGQIDLAAYLRVP